MQVPRKSSRTAANDNCEALSPLVMALFDGETDELQARRARAHLLVCQTCANRWLDWNRSRTLLVSVPPPAPPATLMWRVLLACRGAAIAHPNRVRSQVLAQDFALQTAPASLSDQILARTTRSSEAPHTANRVSNRARHRLWPALAVPSLALWLLVLQREPLLLSFNSHNSRDAAVSDEPSVPRANASQKMAKAAAVRSVSASARRKVADFDAENGASAALASALNAPTVSFAAATSAAPRNDLSAARQALLSRQWQQIQLLTSNAPRPAEASRPFESRQEVQDSSQTSAFTSSQIASMPRARFELASFVTSQPDRLAIAPRATRRSMQRNAQRAAQLSSELSVPRLRTAQWQVSSPRATGLAETQAASLVPSRVSVPLSSAPTAARAGAENLDADEDRVEEMRSVVDDFRAALAPEEANAPEDEDEEWG